MGFCSSGCASNVPKILGAGCRITTRPAGFDRAVFKRCDYTFADITSLNEWSDALASGAIGATGRVLGSKPKGSPTKKKLASCLPERTTNYNRTWNWKDSNADLSTLTEYDFYQFIDENQDVLHVGFLTCDSLFYGFFEDYSLDVDDTRVDTSDEDAGMEAGVEIKSRLISKPTKIPGLAAILSAPTSS